MRYFLFLTSLFLWLAAPCNAIRSLDFEWINDRNGLSQNTVRCILQDNTGFIWFGTINGLNRYNGREFVVMDSQSGVQESITDNRIRSLTEDKNGYIWVRTMANTYSCYDPNIERFVDYNPQDVNKNYSNRLIAADDDVWLWYDNAGCYRIVHKQDGSLEARYFGKSEFGTDTVTFVFDDNEHRIWTGTGNGVYIYENERFRQASNGVFSFGCEYEGTPVFINDSEIMIYDGNSSERRYRLPFQGLKLQNAQMSKNGVLLLSGDKRIVAFDCSTGSYLSAESLFEGQAMPAAEFYTDNKGAVWVYNHTGCLWQQNENGKFEKRQLIPPDILALIDNERFEVYHDSRNIIWITTYGNGLFALDASDGGTYHYTVENSDLPTNFLLSVIEDKSGEIWVGTEFKGVCKISLNDCDFNMLTPNADSKNVLDNAVRMLYMDSNEQLWAGTRSGGLYIYDKSFNLVRQYRLKGGAPYCMSEDSTGKIRIGTRGNGVMEFDGVRMTSFKRSIETANRHIFGIICDRRNRAWIATFGSGLYCIDGTETRNITSGFDARDRTRAIICDRSGLIWTGSNEGITVFDPDSLLADVSKQIRFSYNVNDDNSLNTNEVKTIFEDSHGRLWFGTTGGGLNLLVRQDPLERSYFKHYTAKNGLSNEVIQSIVEDDSGAIWVSTEGGSGISRFNVVTERFENFNFRTSRQVLGIFDENAALKLPDGRLMFGSYAGAVIFDPAEMQHDDYTPEVTLTGLKINGINVYPREKDSPIDESISRISNLKLRHNQNSFNIEFAMLNFRSADFNQYAFMLEGYEKAWNEVTRYNIASYRNVPPGAYRFRVKGCNSYGVWNENETTLSILITPPFWKSREAYLLYLLTLTVMAYVVFRLMRKFNRLHTAVEVERQLTDYKLRFFTNISHEFRTPLTIIQGSVETLADTPDLSPALATPVRHIAKSSSRLMRMINQLLEFRKLQNRALELRVEKTDAVAFMYEIYQMFVELAAKKNIDLRFECDREHCFMLLDSSKMEKIAYNLMSNAVKHTPNNGLTVMRLVFSEADDTMTLSVSDSGEGVSLDKRSSLFVRFAQLDNTVGGMGVGLHLAAELTAVHKGRIAYSDSPSGGACFSVTIPLSDANYANSEIVAHTETRRSMVPQADNSVDCRKPTVSGCKALIIEDDDDVRDFVADSLRDGMDVTVAKDGEEGLRLAYERQPDVIVCDVMMPGIDGFEVTRRLKDNFLTCHIPVILLTAYASDDNKLEGIEAGADSYITKPFSVKYLKARINKLIEQREQLRRKYTETPQAATSLITITDRDKAFLDKINALIDRNIDNVDFNIDAFAAEMNMARSTLFKKVKGITGNSPNEYITIERLKRAAEMIVGSDSTIAEIAYSVGFNDPLYFSRCFKAQFGQTPTACRAKAIHKQD